MMATRTKPTIKDLPIHGFYNGFFTTNEKTDLSKIRSYASCIFKRSNLAI
jgi:hypothetical protein